MKAKPILFSGPMVRALIEGRKTQTRRKSKIQDWDDAIMRRYPNQTGGVPYQVGDALWVREAWSHDATDLAECQRIREDAMHGSGVIGCGPYYRATEVSPDTLKWKPGIHMPRWASRLTLSVTEVRVQRLKEISAEDALAEGVYGHHSDELNKTIYSFDTPGTVGVGCRSSITISPAGYDQPQHAFCRLWELINGAASWDANPWVVAASFAVHKINVDEFLAARKAA